MRPIVADEYFTLVFKGSLREFKGNPLKTETPFGMPFICAIGNVCDEADELRERLETLTRDDVEAPLPFGDVGTPRGQT